MFSFTFLPVLLLHDFGEPELAGHRQHRPFLRLARMDRRGDQRAEIGAFLKRGLERRDIAFQRLQLLAFNGKIENRLGVACGDAA